jgi:hypothetical protein
MKTALKLVDGNAEQNEEPKAGAQIVRLQAWTQEGPVVQGVPRTVARWSSSIVREALVKACNEQHEALVHFADGGVPVILALLASGDSESPIATDVLVDGKRVELVANEELTLRCGDACISLMKDGRVIVRGVQVETRAKGANRIRGGTVEIN